MEQNMNSSSPRLDDFAHPLAASSSTAWIVGGLIIALGVFCAFAAFTAPVLFGPLVAFVIGSERLLRATQARTWWLGAVWVLLALAWFGSTACMLHTPLLGNASMQSCAAMLASLLILNAGCWTWSRVPSSPTWRYEVAPVLAGTAGALILLYGGPSPGLSRIAAAAAVALALVGCEWIAAALARSMTRPGRLPYRRGGLDSMPAPRWARTLEPHPL
jgi:hypothetical protein